MSNFASTSTNGANSAARRKRNWRGSKVTFPLPFHFKSSFPFPLILAEKQAKRKEIRAEQEKKLAQQKKEEEERLRKEENEKKAKEAEEKKKRLEEAEMKRQAMMQAQKEKQQAAGKNDIEIDLFSKHDINVNFGLILRSGNLH